MNTAIFSATPDFAGIGFAVPLNAILCVVSVPIEREL
jgi:hypothetical protein